MPTQCDLFNNHTQLQEARIRAGETVNADDIFDSNCITPGTEFMAALSEHLRYFIRKKIKEDASWQKVRVIFSGHEVRRVTLCVCVFVCVCLHSVLQLLMCVLLVCVLIV
jgi:hypothetical protein